MSDREKAIKLLVAKFMKLVESLEPGERLSIRKVGARKRKVGARKGKVSTGKGKVSTGKGKVGVRKSKVSAAARTRQPRADK
jgi:hypothetical protein